MSIKGLKKILCFKNKVSFQMVRASHSFLDYCRVKSEGRGNENSDQTFLRGILILSASVEARLQEPT